MNSLRAGRRRFSRPLGAILVCLAVAAPAALAASTSAPQGVVHTRVDASGTVVVSGYDGGVALSGPAAAPPGHP